MSTAKSSLALIAILCLALLAHSKPIKSLFKAHILKEPQVFVHRNSLDEMSLAYALCDETVYQPEKKCSIVLENNSFNELASQSFFCNVTLKPDIKDAVVGRPIRTLPFGKNKVILIWLEINNKTREAFLKVDTVHLSSCRVSEADAAINTQEQNPDDVIRDTIIISYETSYDVVFENAKLCGINFCKLIVEPDNNKLTGPFPWIPVRTNGNLKVLTVKKYSPAKVYLLVKDIMNTVDVSLLVDKDEEKLKEFSTTGNWSVSQSSIHESLGVCFAANKTVNCVQYDQQGKQKLEAKVELARETSNTAAMYNLAQGGFLLMTSECPSGNCNQYQVTKVAANGKQTKLLSIKDLECDLSKRTIQSQFFENFDSDHCLSLLCLDSDRIKQTENKGSFDLLVKCITAEDV